MISVLFVCLGNICRSPMAEAVFRHYVREEGLDDQIRVDSAGTGDWHTGEPPHHGTRKKLDQYGISYEGIRARQVKKEDFSNFTYIIGMDNRNVENLHKLSGNSGDNVYRFVDFIPNTTYTEVPDPWYTGNFDETYELVSAGCRHLLDKIKREHHLE
ncbi:MULTISPECIES: low molecular weight protein-tyrosine-phosphatase [Thermoactinomyces]|uniref:protein-tyrosine-phosphatase n=1 Tax=Thermoactinomyces daqus TaxID=1329516 RepID=A0A7W2AH24_9BACL|nr:low molecular weight protein-tyrosine-phosphatase [Thermoactinomyces daqus]MBA4541378.1 low molecular weight phosphotyrosine protein phosphatase [Thermoactinomyces daqus]MBH8603611.1 low molecular weight phosphotyrosine protein phosphatase [Thermoactinomyces sp. CICC 10522]MBH8606776.1 low molecular weight phosphotyrosine protein phosphatase [Thermoactinomyces sp. CICC 10521]